MAESPGRVAVVIPLRRDHTLLPDERISLRHLDRHLASYDRYFVAPAGTPAPAEGDVISFPDRFFGTQRAHSDLLLWPEFYERFGRYEFILIYHLDALVFSDQLLEWCDRGFDYVGAPWIHPSSHPDPDNPLGLGSVGNGGFSLRRVEGLLRVLRSRRRLDPPYPAPAGQKSALRRAVHRMRRVGKRLGGVRLDIDRYLARGGAEDVWLATRAQAYWPDFRIASLQEALEFSFELSPAYCYELTGGRLPFGCHAWTRYEPEFWESHLLSRDR